MLSGDRLSWEYCALEPCQTPAQAAPPVRVLPERQDLPWPSVQQKPQPTTLTPLPPPAETSGSWEPARPRSGQELSQSAANAPGGPCVPNLRTASSHSLARRVPGADAPVPVRPAAPQAAEQDCRWPGGSARGTPLYGRAVLGPQFLCRQPHRPVLGADGGPLPPEQVSTRLPGGQRRPGDPLLRPPTPPAGLTKAGTLLCPPLRTGPLPSPPQCWDHLWGAASPSCAHRPAPEELTVVLGQELHNQSCARCQTLTVRSYHLHEDFSPISYQHDLGAWGIAWGCGGGVGP